MKIDPLVIMAHLKLHAKEPNWKAAGEELRRWFEDHSDTLKERQFQAIIRKHTPKPKPPTLRELVREFLKYGLVFQISPRKLNRDKGEQ